LSYALISFLKIKEVNLALKLLKYPEPKLRERALSVEQISKDIYSLIDNMLEIMLKEDGVGLAANQIGSLLRIFVLNRTPHDDNPTPIAFINPKILDQEGTVVEEEGCLSFPGFYLRIKRSAKIRTYAKNLYNEDLIYETDGLLARAIQHEIDHLNGVLFIDRVDKTEAEKVRLYLQNLKSPAQSK
jgi:peptide deformylase